MSNSIQYLPTYRSGFTGPSERIGGSSEYHIDLKVLQTLPLQERIRAMDSLAKQYSSIGREIEFSNQAVSGRRWDPTAPLEEKVNLLESAARAHAPRGGWDSYDFYVPFKGKSRFEPGAVEGASIFIPGVPGGKIRRGSGGGYGYFSEAMDPSGRVVFRVGHGDVNRPETQAEILVEDQPLLQTLDKQEQDKAAETLLSETIRKLTTPRQVQPQPSYAGPDDEVFRRRREQLDEAMIKVLLNKASEQEEKARIPILPQNGAAAAAAQLAQRGFATPKSVI